MGITSWNSELFLGHCIDAVRRTTDSASTRIVIADNMSTDKSTAIAEERCIDIMKLRCSQAEALNRLFDLSRSEYTLLIHADVILLSKKWLEVCASHLMDNIVMVSPEDIGCGPYTRPWGKDMPESSFLLFRTDAVRAARRKFRKQRFKIKWRYRAVDFYGDHVTYNLPSMLKEHNLTWKMMSVHTSSLERTSLYSPRFKPKYWNDSLGYYRYGLGNFYSIDGHITHYHNWFDRISADSMGLPVDSEETYPKEGGLPMAYVRAYTMRFISDLINGYLDLPVISGNNNAQISGDSF